MWVKILIDAGDNPKDEKIITGTVLAFSSSIHVPATGQIDLLSRNHVFNEEDLLTIRRYFLNRDNYILKSHFGKLDTYRTKTIDINVLKKIWFVFG